MKPFKHLLSSEVAIKIIMETVQPVERTEAVSITQAAGRVLSEDAVAGFNVPTFDRASMDGYAVKAEDTYGASAFNPRRLCLVHVQHAGELYDGEVGSGECVQIATGSPIPRGADAVVMVEYTRLDVDEVEIQRPAYPGANISPIGEDIKAGNAVLPLGTPLTPARLGVLAALNMETVHVYVQPSVAIFSTGPEVKPLGTALEPGQIYDVNSHTLSSMTAKNGCRPSVKGIVPDERNAMVSAVLKASKHDMGVFSGGSSVGARDIFADVVEDLGEVLFHGLQVKPGKPTLFGIVEGTPIFGMPGYPTSCLSNAYIFLTPALRKLARLPPREPRVVRARTGSRIVSSSGREQFLTVRLEDGVAHTVYKKSGAITSMADADGYVILPVNLDVIEEGEEVEVTLIE